MGVEKRKAFVSDQLLGVMQDVTADAREALGVGLQVHSLISTPKLFAPRQKIEVSFIRHLIKITCEFTCFFKINLQIISSNKITKIGVNFLEFPDRILNIIINVLPLWFAEIHRHVKQ